MAWDSINQFLVKEHVGMFKASKHYDIFDLQSGNQVLSCKEETLGFFTKLLRFTDYSRMTPFALHIRDMENKLVLEVSRGISIFFSTVIVKDSRGKIIGSFKQHLFSIGGKFAVLDKNDKQISMLQGKWTGWSFSFKSDQVEHAQVTKEWAGIGREFFTTADNYVLNYSGFLKPDSDLKKLILAAVMCVDMVLKE